MADNHIPAVKRTPKPFEGPSVGRAPDQEVCQQDEVGNLCEPADHEDQALGMDRSSKEGGFHDILTPAEYDLG